MAKQLGSSRFKEWEMIDITSKPRGLRRSRMLKVKSTSSVDEEADVDMVEESTTQRHQQSSHNRVTQLRRVTTTHHVR